jgi:hypothetical protein
VVAAAADDLCKDMVSQPKDLRGESTVICTVNFKGADGKVLPVQMPEARVCGCGSVRCGDAARAALCVRSRKPLSHAAPRGCATAAVRRRTCTS